jgi:serine/threonine protein kinase
VDGSWLSWTKVCDPTLHWQNTGELRHAITVKVPEIVQKLHDAGFVHGDIRSANLLVDRSTLTSKDGIKIHFIDFDWAGRQGEAVYPMCVNRVTVRRPEGASDGKPILVEHDIAMVNSLVSSLGGGQDNAL